MIKKIMAYVPSVAIPILVNILLVFLYARCLKPEEYGMLNIVLNTINIIYSLVMSFIQSASFRFYSDKSLYSSREEYVSSFVFCNIIVGFLVASVTALVSICTGQTVYFLIAVSVGINGLYQFYLNLYRLEGRNSWYIASRIIAAFLILISFVAVVKLIPNLTYEYVILTTYGSYAVFAFIGTYQQRKYLILKEFSFNLIKKAFVYGMPMMGVTLLGNIISSCDQYVLKFYMGDFSVGLYSLGHKLSDMSISNITMLLLLVATPMVMREYDQSSKSRGVMYLSKILFVNIWVVVLVAIGILAFADEIILYLFPEYSSAEQIISLVAIAAVLHSVSLITCKPFELTKNTMGLMILLLVTAIINVAYNVVFIPIYGINAASHSSIIAYLVYIFLLYIKDDSSNKVCLTLKECTQIVIPSLITFVITLTLKQLCPINSLLSLMIQAIICVFVYFVVSLICGVLKNVSSL